MSYEFLGRKAPLRKKFQELLKYSGYYRASADRLLGFLVVSGLVLGAIAFVVIFLMTRNLVYSILSYPAVFLIFYGTPFVYLSAVATRRASEVDRILPDALQLMAANVRAGMTTERAIWMSARPEFGPLEDEIHRISSKVMGGVSLTQALDEMSEHISSDLLDRAVKLMKEGIQSGGEMATLLDETATDIRTAHNMRDKVRANVTMYSMFIVFASVIGAPLLFALSVYFIEVTTELWVDEMAAADFEGMGGMMMDMGGPEIDASTIRYFSIAAISITTFFGGMIIGLIQKGKSISGIKYSPLMMIAGLTVFFIASVVVTRLLGGFVGI